MLESTQGSWPMIAIAILFAMLACVEFWAPRRIAVDRKHRWLTHIAFFGLNIVLGRLIAVVSVASAAAYASANNCGVFAVASWPLWFEFVLALIVYDFAVWLQHRMMHKIPFLWRAHQVHHSDTHLDVTTALRFHPFELLVSTVYKSGVIILLGVPIWAAIAFEFWLNANALFNHSNIALPRWMDRILNSFLVTPDMHLIHHSTDRSEQNHNFGFGLNIWDRLFGCYLDRAQLGREQTPIGLDFAQTSQPMRLGWSLLLPFHKAD
jgi:sterol desaturase/sphingolipid hydroxylase (fatty acid hydroxylase superfamily)